MAGDAEPISEHLQLVTVLDRLQEVEASLDGLLRRAAGALDAHDKALERPVDPLDAIHYARELSATTHARPSWDGRAHVLPQNYFAPTYEMIVNPNSWQQIAARSRPPPPPPRGGAQDGAAASTAPR
ncbi:hypothetical protein T492DRAFT_834539 [Pavlovales sp. CCMP2436]|nr:hypothetical protein T492DRAFT_834539 [Pavlovales sp. CCMP2436]|mmetsp:Transcript_36317/g.90617  ORF Transcript_36317/g.90617 Transcript_36317/m.90617 type:complete len:127 (+) Transcript_36317:245-625(+)